MHRARFFADFIQAGNAHKFAFRVGIHDNIRGKRHGILAWIHFLEVFFLDVLDDPAFLGIGTIQFLVFAKENRQRILHLAEVEVLIERTIVQVVMQDAEIPKTSTSSTIQRHIIGSVGVACLLPVPAKPIQHGCSLNVCLVIDRAHLDLWAILP